MIDCQLMPASPPSPAPMRPAILTVLGILAPVLWGSAALLSLPLLMMSAMMFDSPGSADSTVTIGLFLSLLSLPVLAVLSAVATPIVALPARGATTDRGRRRLVVTSMALCALPLVSVAGLVLFITLLQIYCEGQFAC